MNLILFLLDLRTPHLQTQTCSMLFFFIINTSLLFPSGCGSQETAHSNFLVTIFFFPFLQLLISRLIPLIIKKSKWEMGTITIFNTNETLTIFRRVHSCQCFVRELQSKMWRCQDQKTVLLRYPKKTLYRQRSVAWAK